MRLSRRVMEWCNVMNRFIITVVLILDCIYKQYAVRQRRTRRVGLTRVKLFKYSVTFFNKMFIA